MPKTYELRTLRPTVFDGQQIDENKVIAVMITDQPLHLVMSAAAFGTLQVSELAPTAAPLAVVARAEEKTPPPIPATEPADPADDPDALNAEDAAADAAEAAAKPEPEPEQRLPAEFEGLSVRIASALVRQGLASKAAIKQFVADGGDLVDLEEIGTAAVAKINAWLEG